MTVAGNLSVDVPQLVVWSALTIREVMPPLYSPTMPISVQVFGLELDADELDEAGVLGFGVLDDEAGVLGFGVLDDEAGVLGFGVLAEVAGELGAGVLAEVAGELGAGVLAESAWLSGALSGAETADELSAGLEELPGVTLHPARTNAAKALRTRTALVFFFIF